MSLRGAALSLALMGACVLAAPALELKAAQGGSTAANPPPTIRLGPQSSPRDAAQWALDFVHCRDVNGSARVVAVRPLPADSRPDARPRVMVVLGGDFHLGGLAPGFDGRASFLVFEIDLMAGSYGGIGSRQEVDSLLLPTDLRLDLRPSTSCVARPSASRDPRLAQNCAARGFAIVPRVCGGIGPLREAIELGLDDNVFVPAEIYVPPLTEVTWINYGRQRHTIAGPGWEEPVVMNPGDSWIVAFASPGAYEYRCRIHPAEMQLRLTVMAP